MRVGEDLVGAPPQRATPRAVAVLSTVHGGSTFTWEEWQLLAHDGSDVWVEYDHDTRDVTLLHPTEPWPPVVDLAGLSRNSDLWLAPLEGGEPRRLTSNPASDSRPRFSPDGRKLAFLSTRDGSRRCTSRIWPG